MEELVEALPEELSAVYLQRLSWIKVCCGMSALKSFFSLNVQKFSLSAEVVDLWYRHEI